MALFEPYDMNGAAVTKQLKDIPIQFTRPTDSKKMKLVGIVNYHPPTIFETRSENSKKKVMKEDKKGKKSVQSDNKENIKRIGHYVAICKRRDGSWICYDDRKPKPKRVRKTMDVQVALMLYAVEK